MQQLQTSSILDEEDDLLVVVSEFHDTYFPKQRKGEPLWRGNENPTIFVEVNEVKVAAMRLLRLSAGIGSDVEKSVIQLIHRGTFKIDVGFQHVHDGNKCIEIFDRTVSQS